MRIASLVPSATEMAFALGLGEEVVAVTHECDHPPDARRRPRLTASVLEPGLDEVEIDAAVRERVERGEALYTLDAETLAAARPDVVLTQALCPVCAVSHDDVVAIAAELPGPPAVVSTNPSTLTEVLADAERIAAACERSVAGRELRSRLEARIERVRQAVAGRSRPRVAVLEWLDPVYAAGHWVPEMIEAAGGVDILAAPGDRSEVVDWADVAAARPDLILVAPCGLDAPAAAGAAERHLDSLGRLGAERIVATDAAASFSRPGPRLIDGIETVAAILHPGQLPPAPLDWLEVG